MAEGFGGDETILGVTTAEAGNNSQALANGLEGYVNNVQDVMNVQVKFNEEGEAAIIAVRALDEAQRTLNITLAAGEKEWKAISVGAAEATSKYRELAAAAKSVREGVLANRGEQSADAVKQALERALAGPNRGLASPAELAKFDAAVAKLAAEARKAGLSLGDVEHVFQRMIAGADDFTVKERAVVRAIGQAQQASHAFGTEYLRDADAVRAKAEARFAQMQR